MQDKHRVKLKPNEWEYLQRLAKDDAELANLLQSHEKTHGSRVILILIRDEAEQIRERLEMRLILVGFDENYNPNEEGKMCEDLIDRFFVR
jgi:hypothetical protein